jgi:hypothetical protein
MMSFDLADFLCSKTDINESLQNNYLRDMMVSLFLAKKDTFIIETTELILLIATPFFP